MARGIAAGASGDELYRLLCGLATEVHVREYSEFAPVNGGDPDEMWAFVRALHRYDIPELAGAGDLSEADPRTKSICRALLAVTHAAYDAGAPDSCPGVVHHLSPEEPEWDWEPVIVHEGLLDLIRSHPEHGEWIAGTVRERGFDGIEAARTALDGGALTVLADGVL